ncbi:MAG TPA: sterol desaturase family protein [Chitinophagales bacterium]|nr:sterol desaturase family protein [Chitinophagales bacterium]
MAKNFVSNNDESVPMFNQPVLDFFSRVHFSVPLFIFVPVIAFFFYRSVFVFQFSALTILLMVVMGLVVWTFTEYNLHRFVFHWMPPGRIGKKIHFMFHGVHHDYPRDSYRLVMVPPVSVPLAILFYFTFRYLLSITLGDANLIAPFFVGFVIGYLFYDMTHYALHHVNFKSRFWLELKQHHMIHHYQDPDNGFGVSTKFWDLIYRTTFKRKQAAPVRVSKVEPVL